MWEDSFYELFLLGSHRPREVHKPLDVQVSKAVPGILDRHAFLRNDIPRVGSHGQLVAGNFDFQVATVEGFDGALKAKDGLLKVDVHVVVEVGSDAAELMVLALSELEDHITGLV